MKAPKLKKDSPFERLWNGQIKENPTFVLILGMCPTLAVTTGAINGLGMGLSTAAVLILSNMMISLLRKVIPNQVRMPAYIVIVASFVTIVEMLMHAYVTSLYDSLGIYIPLIVVNCIILGRAEAYASRHGVLSSAFDGLGMGLGFTVALTLIGLVRELLGAGTAFGVRILPGGYTPISIFVLAPGAFFVLAALTALQNKLKAPSATNRDSGDTIACGGNCARCAGSCGAANHEAVVDERQKKQAAAREEAALKKSAAVAAATAMAAASATPAPSDKAPDGQAGTQKKQSGEEVTK